jgi:hypothetical protein
MMCLHIQYLDHFSALMPKMTAIFETWGEKLKYCYGC